MGAWIAALVVVTPTRVGVVAVGTVHLAAAFAVPGVDVLIVVGAGEIAYYKIIV